MAKKQKFEKLDAGGTKGVNGGAYYSFKMRNGETAYYVPGNAVRFLDRGLARERCKDTLAIEIACRSEEQAKAWAEAEWNRICARQQVNPTEIVFNNLVDDTIYDGFITGSGTSDLY